MAGGPSAQEFLSGWCGDRHEHRLDHLARAVGGGGSASRGLPPQQGSHHSPAAAVAGAPMMSASPLLISAIKCFAVSIPAPNGPMLWNQCLVKVEAEAADGSGSVHGWGESGLVSRELAVKGAVQHFSQFLVGRDANQIGALWQEMYRSQYFEGGRVLTAAISAIDIALHDLVAKSRGIPVYQLLGGAHRHHIPVFVTSHATMGQDAVEAAQRFKKEGWPCVRFNCSGMGGSGGVDRRTPTPDLTADPTKDIAGTGAGQYANTQAVFEPRLSVAATAACMIEVRKVLGPEVVLMLEMHHRFSVAEAASLAQKLPPGTVDMLEEPIRDESPEAYETLRTLTDIPFAVGEEFSSKWQFLPFIERGLHQYCRVDIGNVGGFTEAMKVAGQCEAHYIDLMPHNPLGPISTAANIQFGAAVPNYGWLEDRSHPEDSAFTLWQEGEAGRVFRKVPGGNPSTLGYELPTAPGLGVEIDEEALKEFEIGYEFSGVNYLRKADGSITNS